MKEIQMYIIVFILGAMFGGTVGVFTMCLVQIYMKYRNKKIIVNAINHHAYKCN